jgi:hypothetical protein
MDSGKRVKKVSGPRTRRSALGFPKVMSRIVSHGVE